MGRRGKGVDRQLTNGSCQLIVCQEMSDGVSGLDSARMQIDIDQELRAGVAGTYGGALRRWLSRMRQQFGPCCVTLIPADVAPTPDADPRCASQEFFRTPA
jgi:hypothetical protein